MVEPSIFTCEFTTCTACILGFMSSVNVTQRTLIILYLDKHSKKTSIKMLGAAKYLCVDHQLVKFFQKINSTSMETF